MEEYLTGKIIWHYTHGGAAREILETGFLKVSEAERKMKVKPPGLWFSLNQDWEYSCNKWVKKSPSTPEVRLTKEQQHEHYGLYRFGIMLNDAEVCSWDDYLSKSNTPRKLHKAMEALGIEQGANPNDWYVSFKDIDLENGVTLQKWDGKEWKQL